MITWILKLIKNYALKEKYNLKKIANKIKENNLLFEIGEIDKEKCEKRNKLLKEDLEEARQINEDLSRYNIRELKWQ